MNPPPTPRLTASALHRLLRIRPGYAPLWLFSRRPTRSGGIGGGNLDLVGVALGMVTVGGVWAGVSLGGLWLGYGGLIVGGTVVALLLTPFETIETWARDRRLHGECVWCGGQLDLSTDACRACGTTQSHGGPDLGGPIPRVGPGLVERRLRLFFRIHVPLALAILVMVVGIVVVRLLLHTILAGMR